MVTNYITIKTFGSSIEAELFRIELKSFGIESVMFDDQLISINPFLALALGGVKVKIADTDLMKVQELFPDLNEYPEYKGTIHEEMYKSVLQWFHHKSIRNALIISLSYLFLASMLTFTCEYKTAVTETVKKIPYQKNHLPGNK